MHLNDNFNKVFGPKPIFGMIHLAGRNPVKRALNEIEILEKEGIDGAIIENYHGTIDDVVKTLEEVSKIKTKVVLGVNLLPNEFYIAFPLAKQFDAKFIQLDHVAGEYTQGKLPYDTYEYFKEQYPDIIVLGGVHPKYYAPLPGSNLKIDLKEGMKRAETIVVTGAGTGVTTPIEKIKNFKRILDRRPLIIGAGLNKKNVYEQLIIGDGAIVGTYFKIANDTTNTFDRKEIHDFMDVVKQARAYKG
ncbi:hypothetical protein JW756_00355 [Candidatus Woesearchaeota archaeon]|nr:hypothetical protein [Candidatus Woesearchaeota archaeon]